MDDQTEIDDSRSVQRYIVRAPLAGFFGSIAMRIIDIGEAGLHIEHAEPLKPTSKGRVGFRTVEHTVSCAAVVIWSRLSKTTNEQGKLLYRSGVRITDGSLTESIEYLLSFGKIAPDAKSLERKRQKLIERAQPKGVTVVRMLTPRLQIPDDHLLLVRQARDRLLAHPDEATKWYNRAKYSMATEERKLEELQLPHKEEVFAVWEYLDRTIDLVTIARIFDLQKGPRGDAERPEV